jgi:hypothetical protein
LHACHLILIKIIIIYLKWHWIDRQGQICFACAYITTISHKAL